MDDSRCLLRLATIGVVAWIADDVEMSLVAPESLSDQVIIGMYIGDVHQAEPIIPSFAQSAFVIQSAHLVGVVLLVAKVVFYNFIGKGLCFLSV